MMHAAEATVEEEAAGVLVQDGLSSSPLDSKPDQSDPEEECGVWFGDGGKVKSGKLP